MALNTRGTNLLEDKLCPTCKRVLPVASFGKASRTSTGLKSQCRECVATYRRRWYAEHRDVELAKAKTREARTRRNFNMRRKYGLTMEQFNAMVLAQSGLCALCRRPPTSPSLDVDHDHATGKVRELLCGKCNKGLGMFDDNPDLLVLAATYIQYYEDDS